MVDTEGQEQMLTGPCEACIQEEQQTAIDAGAGDDEQDVSDEDDDEAESDHGEDDLDLLMSGANEEQTGYVDQMQQAMLAERETREREEYAAMVDQRGEAHLIESRARLRERFEAGTVLHQYAQERPVYFNPIFYTQDSSEIREALARRAEYEARERHIHSGSDDALISGESSSEDVWYRPDLSGPPGRLRRPERMARYFHRTPAEPYDEPMAWQIQGCASTAEEEMLEQGLRRGRDERSLG